MPDDGAEVRRVGTRREWCNASILSDCTADVVSTNKSEDGDADSVVRSMNTPCTFAMNGLCEAISTYLRMKETGARSAHLNSAG